MIRKRLKFYALRLKAAGPGEWPHRLREAWSVFGMKQLCFRLGKLPHAGPVGPEDLDRLKLPELAADDLSDLAEKIEQGFRFTAGYEPGELTAWQDRWNRVFFDDVAWRPGDPDLRSVWEPARLQHVTILIHCLNTEADPSKSRSLGAAIRGELTGWLRVNPFPCGPHYMSAMECGLRIPVFLHALKVVDGWDEAESRLLIQAIYEHAWLIRRRLSLHSSLGNHTVAECLGLVAAGAIFRRSRDGRDWLRTGIHWLEHEIRHQILPDGGPVEQSLSYHRFVLDMYWYAVHFLEANGLHDVSGIEARLTAGETYWSAVAGDSGERPLIGDGDDGHALAPGLRPMRAPKSSKMTTAQSGLSASEREPAGVGYPEAVHFPDSGMVVVRFHPDVRLTFNCGPLGMAPLYNHGHSDALSVTLSMGGRMIVTDSGTYRYNGVPDWRAYFKGTRAHSTVTVDDRDQAFQETGFIWSRPYRCEVVSLTRNAGECEIAARHDGYAGPNDPVVHTRTIRCRAGEIVIRDEFEGEGVHEFELNFHFHPQASVEPDGPVWRVYRDGADLAISNGDDGRFRKRSGEEKPIFGWFSPSYGIKQACGAISSRKRGTPRSVSFVTRITWAAAEG